MIYTDIDKANKRIAELEDQLHTQRAVRSNNQRVVVTNYIECGSDLLDKPVAFPDFLKEDGRYFTILDYCELNNRAVIFNNDKTRFMFGYELSDLHNIFSGLKQLLTQTYGKELGGEDFKLTGADLFWIMTYSERLEFLKLNPSWVPKI